MSCLLDYEAYFQGTRIDYQKVAGENLTDCLIQAGMTHSEAYKIDSVRSGTKNPELIVFRTTRMGHLVTIWALIKEEE